MNATPIQLKAKKAWKMFPEGMLLFAIEDFRNVGDIFKPQIQREGMALHPDCSFLFADSPSCFFVIHVAMDHEGFYRFGYELDEPDSGGGCYPSRYWKNHKKASTLKGCLINALNFIKGMRRHHGQPPYHVYVRTATEALSKIERQGAVQLNLFDFQK